MQSNSLNMSKIKMRALLKQAICMLKIAHSLNYVKIFCAFYSEEREIHS